MGGFLDRWLASQPLQQLARNVSHARHRFDHVHRNADGAALIGHRAGNRLTNPPRGVRAKLEAAAIFEFIDRPHQAGIAFLNEVQETQPAVAVFLGNRYHQPQVAFRQAPFCLLILGVNAFDLANSISQAGGRFLRAAEDLAELLDPGGAFRGGQFCTLMGIDLVFQVIGATAEFVQRANHGFDALGSQAEFLDELDCAFPPAV
jgi:hypothetical protein